MRIVLIFFILSFNFIFSQNQLKIKKIFKQYHSVANDSFMNSYDRSKEYVLANKIDNDSCLVNKYSIKDLKLISVPCFRINDNAFYEYNSEKSLSDFISFNDSVFFQKVYILNKDNDCIFNLDYPLLDLEIERIHKNKEIFEYPFKKEYLKRINEMKIFDNTIFKNYNIRNDVYVFELFGIYSIVFEYHINTNKIFAKWVDGPFERELLEVDLFIKKYNLVNKIKCLAIKDYEFKTFFD